MDEVKKRHWVLTAYLVFSIVCLSIVFILYGSVVRSTAYAQKFSNAPNWTLQTLRYVSLFHVFCLGAIFRWKKWGFWGAVAAGVFSVVINIIIEGKIIENLFGLISIAILYGVLQIGGERKGWTQLT